MATFSELQTRVQHAIIDLPASTVAQVPVFVNSALKTLQRKHNFKAMEAETAVLNTTLATRVLAAVPANFKELRGLPYMITQLGSVIELLNPANRVAIIRELGDNRGGEASVTVLSGEPQAVLLSEPTDDLGTQNFEVYPLPDANSLYVTSPAGQYRIVVPYWKFFPILTGASDQNWLTVNADEYIVQQAASDGFFDDHDEERGTLWKQRAAEQWKDVLLRDKYFRLAGVRELVPSSDAAGSRLRGGPVGLGVHRGL